MRTAAFGITAPVESVTVPRMSPVTTCPAALRAAVDIRHTADSGRYIRRANVSAIAIRVALFTIRDEIGLRVNTASKGKNYVCRNFLFTKLQFSRRKYVRLRSDMQSSRRALGCGMGSRGEFQKFSGTSLEVTVIKGDSFQE